MKLRLLDWLACPACGGDNLLIDIVRGEDRPAFSGHWEPDESVPGAGRRTLTEVRTGTLRCRQCQSSYPVVDGVPRMLPPETDAGPASGHRWTEFGRSVPEFEENFNDLAAPLKPTDWAGKLVLDAGAGFGRHAYFAARYGAEVVALDSSADAVASASRNLGDLVRAHVVQGDVRRPPLKKRLFDIVYSFGVLHHVEAPHSTWLALDELVRPGGRLSTWTYGPRQGLVKIANGALRGATREMSSEQLHRSSQVIAAGLRMFSHTPTRILGGLPGFSSVVTHLPVHDHHRWPFEVVVADVYDRLRVPVTATFPGEELERWYAEAGYADIYVSRRVRNTESFRATGVKR